MYYLQREQPIKKALKEILKKLWSAELESESELEDKSKKRQTKSKKRPMLLLHDMMVSFKEVKTWYRSNDRTNW